MLVVVATAGILLAMPMSAAAQTPQVSCASLGSPEAAKRAIERDPSLAGRLDPDRDGVPCESSAIPTTFQFGSYLAIGAVSVGAASLGLYAIQRRWTRNRTETLDSRIAVLRENLAGAAGVVAEVEREVSTRQELLRKLEEDEKRVRALTGLNRDEVDAVTQALTGQLAQLEKRSLRSNVLLGSVFYVLGVASGILINIYVP